MGTQLNMLALTLCLAALTAAGSCSPRALIKTDSYYPHRQIETDSIFVDSKSANGKSDFVERLIAEALREKGYQLAKTQEQAQFVLSYSIKEAPRKISQYKTPPGSHHGKSKSYSIPETDAEISGGHLLVITLTLSQVRNSVLQPLFKVWNGHAALGLDWHKSRVSEMVQILLDYLGTNSEKTIAID